MTAPAGAWRLVGITAGSDTCHHCGRTLSRLFRVVSPEGVEMTVGRTCSVRLTGYRWQVRVAERAQAWSDAAARWPVLHAALTDLQAATTPDGYPVADAVSATDALCCLADLIQGARRGWTTEDAVLEHIDEMLPRFRASLPDEVPA